MPGRPWSDLAPVYQVAVSSGEDFVKVYEVEIPSAQLSEEPENHKVLYVGLFTMLPEWANPRDFAVI